MEQLKINIKIVDRNIKTLLKAKQMDVHAINEVVKLKSIYQQRFEQLKLEQNRDAKLEKKEQNRAAKLERREQNRQAKLEIKQRKRIERIEKKKN